MFEKVVVCLDGSELAEQILPYVTEEAMHFGSKVALLKEQRAECYLPIYIGSLQADAIKQALMGTPSPGSADDALSLSGIDVPLLRVESASVVIDRFENSVFHASFTIDWRGVPYTIECPCGKALALAVKTRAYIMADEKVLDSAGIGATA